MTTRRVSDPVEISWGQQLVYESAYAIYCRLLKGRTAQCSCGRTMPSDGGGAFMEYRGPGSERSFKSCKHCGYNEVAHQPEHMEKLVHGKDGKRRPTVVERGDCPGFEPHGPWDTDTFYCGCRGWD